MRDQIASTRYHHLDALRALLMMFGIPIHTGTLGENYIFDQLTFLSSIVRMEAFFTISGFVCALIFSKYGSATTIKKRFQSIGIPLFTALILLNPITNYLVYNYHNPSISLLGYFSGTSVLESPNGTMVWHLHLWFLFPLLLYGLLTPTICQTIESVSSNVLFKKYGKKINIFIIGTIIAGSCLIARIIFFIISQNILTEGPFSFIIRETMYNLSFYVLGIFIFKNDRLFTIFHKPHYVCLSLSVILVIGHHFFEGYLGEGISKLTNIYTYAFLAVMLTNVLFTITVKIFDRDNHAIRFFSDASYTVYIFHYVTIYTLATLIGKLTTNTYILFSIIAVSTFIITVLFHRYVILKSALLKLIFNGKTYSKKNA